MHLLEWLKSSIRVRVLIEGRSRSRVLSFAGDEEYVLAVIVLRQRPQAWRLQAKACLSANLQFVPQEAVEAVGRNYSIARRRAYCSLPFEYCVKLLCKWRMKLIATGVGSNRKVVHICDIH